MESKKGRVSFTDHKGPLFLSVIRERTPNAAIAVIKNSVLEGASGFDLHIPTLDPEYRNAESMKKIIAATDLPVLALHYNGGYDGKPLGESDERRMEQLLMAVEAGASAIDMQGYTFDPDMETALAGAKEGFAKRAPREVTVRPETIEKQCAFIEKVHSMGAEVVLSTHTGIMMNAEEVVELALTLEKRGADVIKIVGKAQSEDDIPECLRTVLELKKALKVKFAYHLAGKAGAPTRIMAPALGSYMLFCFDRYTESSVFEMCHLGSVADAFRRFGWV